jgi:uncharacterized delta-60 repeat protein
VQPDGRILVGGSFTSIGGEARQHIARLRADGTLDPTFDPGQGANGDVEALALMTDGRILIGGSFTMLAGNVRRNVGRLSTTGALDGSFDPVAGSTDPAAAVRSLLVLPSGKILVGGYSVVTPHEDGTPRHLARLNANGSLDTTFNPRADGQVNVLVPQSDGRILVGGGFSRIGGSMRSSIARLGTAASARPAFTDDPLVSGLTVLRAIHIQELRDRINALRRRFNVSDAVWTDATLTGIAARAAHVQQLRDALLQAYDAAHVTRPAFADNPLTLQSSVRAAHINELRDAVRALEAF